MKPIILFDMDGTLIDANSHYRENIIKTLADLNYKKSIDDFDYFAGVDNFLLSNQINPVEFWKKFSAFNSYPDAIASGEVKLFPDVMKALADASEFADCAIVSNTPEKNAAFALEFFKLNKFFKATCFPNPFARPKPSPDLALLAMQVIASKTKADSSSKRQVFFVGDSSDDILTGKSIKAKTILLTNRPNILNQVFEKPDFHCNTLTEAMEIIKAEIK